MSALGSACATPNQVAPNDQKYSRRQGRRGIAKRIAKSIIPLDVECRLHCQRDWFNSMFSPPNQKVVLSCIDAYMPWNEIVKCSWLNCFSHRVMRLNTLASNVDVVHTVDGIDKMHFRLTRWASCERRLLFTYSPGDTLPPSIKTLKYFARRGSPASLSVKVYHLCLG